MSRSPTSLKDVNYWHLSLLVALIVAGLFLRPFFGTIALAALSAFIFHPVFSWLQRKLNNRTGLSTTLTLLFSLLIVGIPLVLIIMLTVAQANTLIDNVQAGKLDGSSLIDITSSAVNKANDIGERFTEESNLIGVSDVTSFITSKLPALGQAVLGAVTNFVGGIPQFFTLFILYIFLFIAFLQKNKTITDTIRNISPFDKKTNDVYLRKIGAMTKAMVKGQFIIALLQGTIGALSLSVVGFGDYFFFWWILLTALSFIPLGGGILLIPIGIVLVITGNIWQGLLILSTHFIVTTNVDNILRPRLVPKEAHLPAALTILSAFAGVTHYGFLGVIYGPVIMIIIVTTIQTYISLTANNSLENS